jgi:hypothetical protein
MRTDKDADKDAFIEMLQELIDEQTIIQLRAKNKHDAFMRKKSVKGPVGELRASIEALQSDAELNSTLYISGEYSAAINLLSLKYTTMQAIRRRTRRTRVLQHPATPTLQRWPTLSTKSIAL